MTRRRWLAAVWVFILAIAGYAHLYATPLQPGQIFIAYGGNYIGVFADTVSLAGMQAMPPLSVAPSSFATTTLLTGSGGVALDEFGNLYVTVSAPGTGIVKFRADGSVAFRRTYSISGVNDFRSLAVHGGRIYVATNSGIRVFDTSAGDRISSADFGSTLAFRDLAFDSQGNLYGLRESPTGTAVIHRWMAGSLTGVGTTLFTAGGNTDPRALVVDEKGNIYFTANPASARVVRKYAPDGTLLASYFSPVTTGVIIGLDYDPGTQRLFASHTATGSGQILWINRNAPDKATMTAFGPTNLSGVRWLAVYPTPEPTAGLLLLAGIGLGWLVKRRQKRQLE